MERLPSRSPERHQAPASPLEGCKVLVVEDEPVQALDLEAWLRRLGCKVLGPADSVTVALDLLRRERPNLALLDLVLRDGSAVPVARRLFTVDVPFVLVTGYDGVLLEQQSLLSGCSCLRKPYRPIELQRSVHELFRLDLLTRTARLDRNIVRVWERITRQARAISCLAAAGQDTRAAEKALQGLEEILATLELRRHRLLCRLEPENRSRYGARVEQSLP